jgi:hypothetical protein
MLVNGRELGRGELRGSGLPSFPSLTGPAVQVEDRHSVFLIPPEPLAVWLDSLQVTISRTISTRPQDLA